MSTAKPIFSLLLAAPTLTHSSPSPPSPHLYSLLTEMVGADLVCLVSSHDETDVQTVSVLHELHIAHASLLPLWVLSVEVKPKQLGSPAQPQQQTIVNTNVCSYIASCSKCCRDIQMVFLAVTSPEI